MKYWYIEHKADIKEMSALGGVCLFAIVIAGSIILMLPIPIPIVGR